MSGSITQGKQPGQSSENVSLDIIRDSQYHYGFYSISKELQPPFSPRKHNFNKLRFIAIKLRAAKHVGFNWDIFLIPFSKRLKVELREGRGYPLSTLSGSTSYHLQVMIRVSLLCKFRISSNHPMTINLPSFSLLKKQQVLTLYMFT